MKHAWYSKNMDKFYQNKFDSTSVKVSYPFNICIQQNRQCNFSCSFCISESSPLGDADTSWVPNSLSRINKMFSYLRIVWSGGEPSLTSSMSKKIEHSKSLGNINVITTNATRLFLDQNLDWIDVTLYGLEDTSYQRNTGRSRAAICWKNLRHYCEYYERRVCVSLLLGIMPVEEYIQIVDLARAIGVSKIRFQRLLSTPKYSAPTDIQTEALICDLKRAVSNPSSLSFPNSKNGIQKRNGYLYVKAPGILTNDTEEYNLQDFRAASFVQSLEVDHSQMFITPV